MHFPYSLALSLSLTSQVQEPPTPNHPIASVPTVAQVLPVQPATKVIPIPITDLEYYNNNPLYRLELTEGERPLWIKNLVQLGFKTYHPTFTTERILLGDGIRLVLMDPVTGDITWEKTFERELDSFQSDGDLLLYSDHRSGLFRDKGWLHAYSLKDGKQLWEIEEPWRGDGLQFFDGHIYRFASGLLKSLTRDGKEEWSYKVIDAHRLFFFDDLVVCAPRTMAKVLALKRSDGKLAWSLDLKEVAYEQAVHGGTLYLTRRTVNPVLRIGGTIYVTAIDLKTGTQKWQYEIEADDGWFHEQVGGIVTDGDYCVLNTNRRLLGLEAKSGKLIWIANPEAKEEFLDFKPIIFDRSVFAIQTIHKKKSIFQFLDLASGVERSRSEVNDEVIPPTRVIGKSLFLCFRHGDMMSLQLKEPTH